MAVLYIILLIITAALIWAAFRFTGKDSFRKKTGAHSEHIAFALKAAAVCLFIEFGIFNLNSLHLLGGQYQKEKLELSRATSVSNIDTSSGKNISGGYCTIEFTGLNKPVGTLTVDAESDKKSTVNISIDIKDTTNSGAYRGGVASMEAIRYDARSKTIPCNFSGTVYDMKLSFTAEEGETITIYEMGINDPMPVHFSIIRFLVMFLGSFFAYALSSDKLLRRSYELRKKPVSVIAWSLTACLIVISLFITQMNRIHDTDHSLKKDFHSSYGNQISREIVDAFEAGRVDLDIPMNEKLLALDNPYDWSQRTDEVGSYPWDHLLFEGKYYSYYGIGPVLTLFLPYHKLTGYYFPSCWAVWFYGVAGIVFLTMMYLNFADKFFRKINASMVVLGLAIMQMSTGIFLNYYYANFYEIAQASGFFWTVAGAYFMVSSNVIGEGRIKRVRLALSTASLSMAVLSRPTLAVYCIAALLFIWAGYRKLKEEAPAAAVKNGKDDKKDAKAPRKGYLSYFLCALLPFVLIGSIQVWYNWVRFGNPLDFGIQYSLTINDFINSQYHTHFALLGIYSFFVAYPEFSEKFPFMIAGSARTFNANGYYFIATGAALGLIWRALPVTAYCQSRRAYRLSDNKNKRLYSVLLAAVCVICPLIIVFSIWESGFGARYCCDFAWQIILGSLVIMFSLWSRCKENTQRHLNTLMIGAGIVSLAMNFVQNYTYLSPSTNFTPDWQAYTLSFARLFEVWR